MSWIETSPKLAPTEEINKPLQHLSGLANVQTRIFGDVPTSAFRSDHGVKMRQLQFSDIPFKERYFSTVEWRTDQTVGTKIFNLELVPDTLMSIMERATQTFNWLDIDSITIKIRVVSNAAFQGLLWLIWEPSPIPNWLELVYARAPHRFLKSQLERLEITPSTSGDYEVTVPFIFPYDMFPNKTFTGPSQYLSNLSDYLKDYSFGRIYAEVIIPLETNSTSLALNYPVALSLGGFNYGGTNYRLS